MIDYNNHKIKVYLMPKQMQFVKQADGGIEKGYRY